MATLSPKQREMRERGVALLDAARSILLERGYHGLTMARIAQAVDCAKATVYQHFPCKEEIIIALAHRSIRLQGDLVERGARFPGRTRERMLAVGEATQLFARLYPEDTRIFQLMNAEAITQKASQESLWRMRKAAHHTVSILNGIVRDAIAQGDVVFDDGRTIEEFTYQVWLMGESSKAAMWSWMPCRELGIENPFDAMMHNGQILGDAYGWRPLSSEWDYEKSLERIRREVFPAESRKAYGSERNVK
jgi:AcrR family transcriptional regulator